MIIAPNRIFIINRLQNYFAMINRSQQQRDTNIVNDGSLCRWSYSCFQAFSSLFKSRVYCNKAQETFRSCCDSPAEERSGKQQFNLRNYCEYISAAAWRRDWESCAISAETEQTCKSCIISVHLCESFLWVLRARRRASDFFQAHSVSLYRGERTY